MVRDKLLVLAGVQAEFMGLAPISALCRHKVLAHNSRHMIRKWPTIQSALGDERFLTYLRQLERRYSTEKSEHMLATLGIELGRERELYASDLEYAAALLDTDPESIDDLLLQPRSAVRTATPWPGTAAAGEPTGEAKPAAEADARRSPWRQALVVWGPFAVGVSALAVWALITVARAD